MDFFVPLCYQHHLQFSQVYSRICRDVLTNRYVELARTLSGQTSYLPFWQILYLILLSFAILNNLEMRYETRLTPLRTFGSCLAPSQNQIILGE